MSTTASTSNELLEKPELTETDKKVRMNEITELLQKLGEAIIYKDFKLNIKAGQKWNYIPETQTFEYDPQTVYTLSNRGVFAKLVDSLGMAKFYKNPDPKKLEPYVKEPGKLFMQFCNNIAELHIQEQMIAEHPGTYTILEYMFCKEDALISGDVEKALPPHMQYLYALPKLFWKKPISHFDSAVIEALEKTESAIFRACGTPDINDTIAIASTEIWDTFYDLYRDPPTPPSGGGGGGSSGGSGGKGEEGEGEGEGKTQSELSDEEKEQLKQAIESSKSLTALKNKMKEMSQGKESESDSKESFGSDVEAEFDEKENKEQNGSGGAPEEEEEDDILEKAKEDESKGHGASPNGRMRSVEKIPYSLLYREIYHLIPPFKKKLSSIMKDNLYDRQGGKYRTGKLNTKQLFKVATGSDKVFTRKVLRQHKDYKVTVLVDESGSMTQDNKNYYAALGCTLLSEVLSQTHIDFEIIGFNGTIRVYKKFGEPFTWKIRENIEKIIPNSYRGEDPDSNPGCNDDGYAINYATHRMRKNSTRESERMLFVLSDGFPAESGRVLPPDEKERTGRRDTSGSNFELRKEIENAEHDSYVFGIGINAKHVQNYYDHCAVVDDVEELPEVILGQLKQMIRRG